MYHKINICIAAFKNKKKKRGGTVPLWDKAFPFVFDINFYPAILLWTGTVSFLLIFYVKVGESKLYLGI